MTEKLIFPFLGFLLTFQVSQISAQGSCRLPESWRGKWFQSGVQLPIVISSKFIDTKGGCYENIEDKFLFYEAANNCHRCLVINERHPNVIQYKESFYCEDQDDLENMCSNIPGDAQLHTLLRLDAAPEDCPLRRGPFTFAYNRGYGECKSPLSHVDTCTDNSHLLFRYQACPDVQKTESLEEELECLGHWRDGSQDYLVGKIHNSLSRSAATPEESYRCFVFEKMTRNGAVVGYKVAQSGDATCNGVYSSTDGARTLTLTKAESKTGNCKFPHWLHSKKWQSLDGQTSIRVGQGNESFEMIGNKGVRSKSLEHSNSASAFFSPGAKIECEDVNEVLPHQFRLKVVHIVQCKRRKLCIQMHRPVPDVLQLRLLDSECQAKSEEKLVTLVNPDAQIRRCPHLGKYATRGLVSEGLASRDICNSVGQKPNFDAIDLGCEHRETLEFYSNCPQEYTQAYACHGSWEEAGTDFLIASPLSQSGSSRKTCFTFKAEASGTLSVFSSEESCRRFAGPQGFFAQNLTVESRCAEAVISSSTTSSVTSQLLLSLLTVVFLVNPSPTQS